MTETKTDSQTTVTTTAIYTPGVVIGTAEYCAGEVRWNGNRLEQLWKIQHYGTTGAIEQITEEWRLVPRGEW